MHRDPRGQVRQVRYPRVALLADLCSAFPFLLVVADRRAVRPSLRGDVSKRKLCVFRFLVVVLLWVCVVYVLYLALVLVLWTAYLSNTVLYYKDIGL